MINKNVFTQMEGSLSAVIESLNMIKALMVELSQNEIKSLFDNPFRSEAELYFVMNLFLQEYGPEVLMKFQEFYALNAIKLIKEKIFYDEINYKINRDGDYYYLILSTEIYGIDVDLLAVNFFLNEIYLLENAYQNDLLAQIDSEQNRLLALNEHLSNLENSDKNPLYICGDNNFKMIDMMVRKKKYATEIQGLINDALLEINDCERNLNRLKIDLEESEILVNHSDVYKEKLINRLEKYFNFELINNSPSPQSNGVKDFNELNIEFLNFNLN